MPDTNQSEQNIPRYGSMGLKPPGYLTDMTAEGFKRWKQRFQIYCTASGVATLDKNVQVAVLLHSIGDSCIDIYNTFNLKEDEKQSYETVLQRFEDYFVPVKNESVNSHLFFTRNQQQGETFDAYITDLKRLSADCNFGDIRDRLIPIDDSGITPAELLYGRTVKNLIPVTRKEKIERKNFREILEDKQHKQKIYYDKGSKLLKELKIGEKVKIHNERRNTPHESGVVIGKGQNPRSYKIKLEEGQEILGNRKALTSGFKFQKKLNTYDDITIPSKTESQVTDAAPSQPEISNNTCLPSSNHLVTTRSGRIIKKPQYLKDYVCVLNFI